MITRQQVYDRLVEGVKNNELPGIEGDLGNRMCSFRTKDGHKCAFGLFIPEGHPALGKRLTVGHILAMYYDLGHLMCDGMDSQMWKDLQWLHDEIAFTVWDADKFLEKAKQLLGV